MRKGVLRSASLANAVIIIMAINNIFLNGDTSRDLFGWVLLWIITFGVGLVTFVIVEFLVKHFVK